jgi:hypothetical protein
VSKGFPHQRCAKVRCKGKLAPRYIGPYEVIEVCGPVAYRIQLKKGMLVPESEVITEANAWIEPDF